MKLRSFLFMCCVGFITNAFATSEFRHSQFSSMPTESVEKRLQGAGACQVSILNKSYEAVHVYGQFDDGESLQFDMMPFDAPHVISLYFYGYCHYNMYINIDSFSGYRIYTGYPTNRTTIEVLPNFYNRLNAKIHQD